jgi:hypothetical protein
MSFEINFSIKFNGINNNDKEELYSNLNNIYYIENENNNSSSNENKVVIVDSQLEKIDESILDAKVVSNDSNKIYKSFSGEKLIAYQLNQIKLLSNDSTDNKNIKTIKNKILYDVFHTCFILVGLRIALTYK